MRYFAAVLTVSSLVWIAGCAAKTTSPSVTTTSEGQELQAPSGKTAARNDTALVRFIDADPGAASMDVWSGDMSVFSSVAFKSTTPYLEMRTTVKHFELRKTGGTKDLAASRQELFPGRHYTLIALPMKNHESRLEVMNDELAKLEPGKARVRLVNAMLEGGDLGLYVAGTKTKLQHGIDTSIAAPFTDASPGTFEIRQEKRPASPKLPGLEVQADRLYTFVVVGTPAKPDVVRIEDRIDE